MFGKIDENRCEWQAHSAGIWRFCIDVPSDPKTSLDLLRYFQKYRTMEVTRGTAYFLDPRDCLPVDDNRELAHHRSSADSILTEAAVMELKKQAPAGCLLCSVEEWDEEDWD